MTAASAPEDNRQIGATGRQTRPRLYAGNIDHLPSQTPYARFDKRLAVLIAQQRRHHDVFLALLRHIPAGAAHAGVGGGARHLPDYRPYRRSNWVGFMVQWVAPSFLRLVLLPSLMVGQNLRNVAADARSARRSRT